MLHGVWSTSHRKERLRFQSGSITSTTPSPSMAGAKIFNIVKDTHVSNVGLIMVLVSKLCAMWVEVIHSSHGHKLIY